jgi:Family of unknown function (DUF6655)
MQARASVLLGVTLLLCGCVSVRTTSPLRSAVEELAISTAADRAAQSLARQIPPNLKLFLDTKNFSAQDSAYATATIEDQLLRHGDLLVDDPKRADAVIILRTGVLSTNERSTLIGLPQLTLPFFAVGNVLSVPELDFYKRAEVEGIAKFAAAGYDPKTGRIVLSTDPQYGFSDKIDWTALLFFTWSHDDLGLPKHEGGNAAHSGS